MHRILLTGAAGFIGYHTCDRLLADGCEVVGVDNLNDYYSVQLKRDRLAGLADRPGFTFEQVDVADRAAVKVLFAEHEFDVVIHLAAQAGVRYSLENPQAYIDSNLVGFGNILEGCRHHGAGHLTYASSSSVYGGNVKMPFAEEDPVDHPVSLYAATKRANELMAHTYSHLYGLPTTGLRFFTVYGPWGRPDMAVFSFTEAILAGRPIKVFNHGRMRRDFTYVDDVVEGVVRTALQPAAGDPSFNPATPQPSRSHAPFRIFNIGNHQPVELGHFIATLEKVLGVEAIKEMLPMQPGDVEATYADTTALANHAGFSPGTPLEEGLARFVDWYRGYYGISD